MMLDLILLLLLLSSALKLSLLGRKAQVLYALLLAAACWWSLRYAVQLPKPAVQAWVQSTQGMQWLGIVTTLDALVALSLIGRRPCSGLMSLAQLLTCSLALPPALFYLLTQCVFAATGTSFTTVGLAFAAAVAVGLPLLAAALRWLLPRPASRQAAHLLLCLSVCVLALLAAQLPQMAALNTLFQHASPNNHFFAMEIISKFLFGVANALLIPDVILLLVFFVRALVLLVATGRQYALRRHTGHCALYHCYLQQLHSQEPSEAYADYLLLQYEAEAQKDVNLSRLLTKLGPVLGLIGTLISMSPALVGLSTGDISGMAFNMQVVFSATVVGLVISAVGLFTQQLKARWHAQDMGRLEYESQTYRENHEKEA